MTILKNSITIQINNFVSIQNELIRFYYLYNIATVPKKSAECYFDPQNSDFIIKTDLFLVL